MILNMSLAMNSSSKQKRKKGLYLVFLVFLISIGYQSVGQTMYGLPNVISPSPQSTALTKYGDYPMAGYTGLTDITVPLHTVTSRTLSMPISMSFHASGRMANEINGTLGMRWTLNCGGLVTRTVKGLPDEWNQLDTFDITQYNGTTPSFDVLYSACPDGKITSSPNTTRYDSEFDIFNYSLPNGKQGHFILKDDSGTKTPMIIPYEPLKISFIKDPSGYGGYYERITITDIDGTNYIFGKIDTTTWRAVELNWEFDANPGLFGSVPTAWYLTKIISSDSTDEISLSYTQRNIFSYSSSQSATIYDRHRDDDSQYWEYGNVDPYKLYLKDLLVQWHFEQTDVNWYQKTTAQEPTLSGIKFNGGSISLSYTNWFLKEMVIKRDTVPYKKIKFNLDKHLYESELYYLANLSFSGEDSTIVNEKYDFKYYEPESATNDIFSSSKKKDWWGYASYMSNQQLPYDSITVSPIPSASPGGNYGQELGYNNSTIARDGSESNKKIGMLKTIKYPTGGETEFVYESNKYTGGEGPGLRIKEVISRPVLGKNIRKVYTYGISEDGNGFINELLTPGSASRSNLSVAEGTAMHYWTWSGSPGSGTDLQTGYRTLAFFSDPYISFDIPGSLIKYDAVTEYYIQDDIPQHKTQSRYSWENNEQISEFVVTDYTSDHLIYPRKFSNPENAWLKPVLTNKSFYKYLDNQFDLVRKEDYEYFRYEREEAWDMPTYLHTNVIYLRSYAYGQYDIEKNYHTTSRSIYGYGFRNYTTGTQMLRTSTIEDITPTGSIVIKKVNDIDSLYFIKTTEITNSMRDTVKTTYSYPYDFPGVPVYQQMVNRNMLSPVVEQVQENITLNKELNRTKINYQFWQDSTLIQPVTIQKSLLSNTLQTEVTINAYDDKGNMLQVTGKDGVITSYIYGYGQKYPVAKIINKSYSDAISQSGINLSTLNNASTSDTAMRTELDKLRQLSGTLVSTYTYKPLTGMTSETDPNGRTIYYEYDNFNRLKIVRDKDNNILKKICYNYAGQVEDCTSP